VTVRTTSPARATLLVAALAVLAAGCDSQEGDWTRTWGYNTESNRFESYIYSGPPELRLAFVCEGAGPWPVLTHGSIGSRRPSAFSYALDGGDPMGPYSTMLLPSRVMSVPFDTDLEEGGAFVVGLASAETADLSLAVPGLPEALTATVGVRGLNAAVVEMDCQ
jgi:hypothetical protein